MASTNSRIDRRRLIQGAVGLTGMGAASLSACATSPSSPSAVASAQPRPYPGEPLAPLRASVDRLFDLTVCLRPFRAAGPRLEIERLGDLIVVHNYGHGGSGWSLSWGSSSIAVEKAMSASPTSLAVIGCGALGLTSAILAQRAGAKVTIYAKELLPQTRSARATGSWTPDSRIALTSAAGPGFAALWEQMARTSFKTYRTYLGLPGDPVEWLDRYTLLDVSRDDPKFRSRPDDPLGFAEYHDSIRDITTKPEAMPRGSTPFDAPFVYRSTSMMFNIADYGHILLNDFLTAGGRIVRMEFHDPADLAKLPEKVVINCPGYGARALWRDETIVPVRGQIGWLIPQPEVRYGLYYKDVSVLPRRDGIVVQALEGGDMKGYADDRETPNRDESERAVRIIADLFRRFGGPTEHLGQGLGSRARLGAARNA